MSDFPKTNEEFFKLIGNNNKFKDFLQSDNFIKKSSICSNKYCIDPTDNKITFLKDNLFFKCNLEGCRRRWSVRNNIFNFIKCSYLKLTKIFEIIWYWSWNTTVKETSNHTQLNSSTVRRWFNKIRKCCYFKLLCAPPMGGQGYSVQIDESLYRGKRKYNKGRLLKGDEKPKKI